jgi:hypothetical protein
VALYRAIATLRNALSGLNRPNRPWPLPRCLRRVYRVGHEYRTDRQWSRYRARLEGRATRAFSELPSLCHALGRLTTRDEGRELQPVLDALLSASPEALGLDWYTPPPRSGGKARRRIYVRRARWSDVSAFVALVAIAWRFLDRYHRLVLRESRRQAAALLARLHRDRRTSQEGSHPHPPSLSLSLQREREVSSEQTAAVEQPLSIGVPATPPADLHERVLWKIRETWREIAARHSQPTPDAGM